MRVVLLTTGQYYGRWVAEGLRARGVALDAVVLDLHCPTRAVAARRPRRVLGVARRRVQVQAMRRFAPLHVSCNLNARKGIALLRSLEPDLLLLGGARILRPDALAIATYGTLNAHPARLPGLRGTGVVAWSILEGSPVTATVHFAAPDVDAGDVVQSELVPVHEGDTLAQIEARAIRMCADALADVAARAWRGEELPRTPQEPVPHVYRRPDPDERARCETLVEDGEAVRLYRAAVHA